MSEPVRRAAPVSRRDRPMTSTTPFAFLERHDESALEDLRSLLAHPSISATGEGIDDCAALVRRSCLEYGFDEAEIVETPGRPAVIARAFADGDASEDGSTALLYGHYDVQPVTASEWQSP
ncbi:hypothetical protein ACFQE6_21620, partial [Natrinema soli]